MNKIICLVVGLLIFTVNNVSHARQIFVDGSATGLNNGSSWANAYKYLNSALQNANAAGSSDTIFIAGGVYYPTGIQYSAVRDSSFGIYRSGIKLYGGYGHGGQGPRFAGEATILSGNVGNIADSTDNSYHVMAIYNHNSNSNTDTVVIDGLSVTGGMANDGISPTNNSIYRATGLLAFPFAGAGIIIRNCLSTTGVLFKSCNLYKNKCYTSSLAYYSAGGAIYSDQTRNLKLIDCNLYLNKAESGAAMFYQIDSSISHSGLVIKKCNFKNNTAYKYWPDSSMVIIGISALSASIPKYISISETIFQNNNTEPLHTQVPINYTNAGPSSGLHCDSLTLYNCSFLGNIATYYALYATVTQNSVIRNCVFDGNTAYRNGVVGLSNGKHQMENCVFANNKALEQNIPSVLSTVLFPKIFSFSTGFSNAANQSAQLNNCTFYNNEAVTDTSFYRADSIGQLTFNNCVFWDKINAPSSDLFRAPGINSANNLTISYSTLQKAQPGTGNMVGYPLFLDTLLPKGADQLWGTADDGLQLLYCSSSINSGNNSLVPTSLSSDIKGTARIAQGTVDRGAYESTATAPPNPSVLITASTPNPVCATSALTFTATPTLGGTNPTYQWKRNGVIVGGNGPTYTLLPAQGDVITCMLTSNAICISSTTANSAAYTIQTQQAVTPGISIQVMPSTKVPFGVNVNFTASASFTGTPIIIDWFKNAVPIAGVSGYTWTAKAGVDFQNGDLIQARLVSNYPCRSVDTVWSTATTMVLGIRNQAADLPFKIYPNPSNGMVYYNGCNAGDELKIFDAMGRLLYSHTTKSSGSIDLAALADGVYIAQLKRNGEVINITKLTKR